LRILITLRLPILAVSQASCLPLEVLALRHPLGVLQRRVDSYSTIEPQIFLVGALANARLFGQGGPKLPAFAAVAAQSGVRFVNQASHTSQKYLPESMVGGVAMLDYNKDGHLDLFFVNGAALADPMTAGQRPDKFHARFWNRLYRNNGDGTFTDVTEAAGVQGHSYGMGVAVGDYDNDGFGAKRHN
jgi:hypothetical protein